MSCAHCNHQWWQQVKKVSAHQEPLAPTSIPMNNFQNFTNIDGLQKTSREPESQQEKVIPEFYRPFGKERNKSHVTALPQEELTAVSARALKAESKDAKQTFSSSRITFFLFMALFISVLGGLSFVYKDQLASNLGNLIFSSQQSLATATDAPLVLQNVKYGVQSTTDGKVALTVVGEILNDNPSTAALMPVRVVVWSHCPENNGDEKTAAAKNCIKADWQHPWTRPHILPGEHLWFQTGTTLPADTQVIRVDVTLP